MQSMLNSLDWLRTRLMQRLTFIYSRTFSIPIPIFISISANLLHTIWCAANWVSKSVSNWRRRWSSSSSLSFIDCCCGLLAQFSNIWEHFICWSVYVCMCRVYVFTYVCANFSVRIVIRAAYQAGEACQLPRSLCAPGRIWSAAAAAANVVPELCNLARLYIDLYTGSRPKRVCVYFDNVAKKWKVSLIPCNTHSILFFKLL